MYDFDMNTPIYIQIMEIIKQKIIHGEWKQGDQIPSVRELALTYGVNPNTVQKALSELEREHVVQSQRTAGRFVTMQEEEIQQVKQKQAHLLIQEFKRQMSGLGYTTQQMIEELSKEEK